MPALRKFARSGLTWITLGLVLGTILTIAVCRALWPVPCERCPVPVEICVADPLWEYRAWQAVELVEDCEARLRAAGLTGGGE